MKKYKKLSSANECQECEYHKLFAHSPSLFLNSFEINCYRKFHRSRMSKSIMLSFRYSSRCISPNIISVIIKNILPPFKVEASTSHAIRDPTWKWTNFHLIVHTRSQIIRIWVPFQQFHTKFFFCANLIFAPSKVVFQHWC